MKKDIPSEEIKTGEEDDDDNGDNLLKDSNDSKSSRVLYFTLDVSDFTYIYVCKHLDKETIIIIRSSKRRTSELMSWWGSQESLLLLQ